jgi:putative acetyltransferase
LRQGENAVLTHIIRFTYRGSSFQEETLEIKIDDLRGPEIAALLLEHMSHMERVSPPESRHALNIDGLRQPGVTFWSAWQDGALLGCAALKELDAVHAELKSMRTASGHLRKGVAAALLQHVIDVAGQRGYDRISLETGSMDYFDPARTLYTKFGFVCAGPFASYRDDPNSVFMAKVL